MIQIALGCALAELDLPSNLLQHPSANKAIQAVKMASNIYNDILGYHTDPPNENLVSAIERDANTLDYSSQHSISLEEAAIQRAALIHNKSIEDLIDSINALVEFANDPENNASSESIFKFCSQLYTACNGISFWQSSSGRYL